ncbi:hypothetical protein BCR44DRAFT_1412039 [Catenaria anguillulae PL171]|uniref:CNNM transmembrane domain-containing protein n=1 Tax=Catenaria anguillulae PL171 TaxID=765915 RepID=A0A1Y2HYE5_9FUNG|nr:hypothetical protein BCR44DRAFT_1412039 [Catenaria anguillulae PL171]
MGHTSEGGGSVPTREAFWLTIALILFLVMLGGLFAGLTLGLLSLDLMALDVLEASGSERERRYAKRIKPIRQRGHWLLVTLLLSNVIVNETLPILTDSVWSGGWPAVVISSTLIVIFGEVIPQAVCSRYGLRIGATFAGFVWLLMVALSPVAWPLAKLLDSILGEAEGTTYKRAELKALVSLHEHSEQHFGPLSNDEVTIIKAVLDLRDKSVASIMTPLEHVYMLNWDELLDEDKVHELVDKGHSRVPVFAGTDRRNIVGMLLVKKLVSYEPSECRKVKDFVHFIHSVPVLEPNANCYDVLNLFQEGRSHLAVVVDDDPRLIRTASFGAVEPESRPVLNVLGIITLEDVIEELIGEEIIDETDLYVDVTRQDLVRRFKSPKVGPNATPRLGPMPQPIAASAASTSQDGRMSRSQPSGLPLRRTVSSMSGIPSLTTPLLGPSNPHNGPPPSSHVTTFDYGLLAPHHADSTDAAAKSHLPTRGNTVRRRACRRGQT